MKIKFSRLVFSITILFSFLILTNVAYAAQTATDNPDSGTIAVVNNAGKSDTVSITSGLSSGDLVKVYSASTGGKTLGSVRVYGSHTDATVTISQLGTIAGKVYVSVTSIGMLESGRVEAGYDAEPVSDAPDADNITVTNNAGKSDTVDLTGLSAGDTVKVYNASTGGKQLGSAKVPSGRDYVTVTIAQLSTTGGSVYVSITGLGENESSRTEADYLSEPVSDSPVDDNVTFTNNAGASDTVNVSCLSVGDTVKIYNASKGGKLLGSAKVATNSSEATVTVSQLGSNGGTVYITVTSLGQNESGRVGVNFSGETASQTPSTDNITITNNAGSSDTIVVGGLLTGDVVKVYNSKNGGKLLGSSPKVPSNKSEATVTISQLGAAGGNVYISVVSLNELESVRTDAISFPAENQSDAPDLSDITIVNNPAGTADTIDVCNLYGYDVVKVYSTSTGSKILGSGTVGANNSELVISIAQLGTTGGNVYISVTNKGNQESARTTAPYLAEAATTDPGINNIVITNNVGKYDTVDVAGISTGDVIKVYDSNKGGKLLGSATVAANKTDGTVSISQLGSSSGKVYVSVISKGKLESSRIAANYSSEQQSLTPGSGYILVTNNPVGTADTILVTGLSSGDIVKVYDALQSGNLLGTATASNASQATASVSQLGSASGKVFVSITSTGKLESARTEADYLAEAMSSGLNSNNIRVTNNAGVSDTVDVGGLTDGDTVKVYDSLQGGKLLGSAGVSGSVTNATITIAQLGTTGGSVYVTLTSKGALESGRVQAKYLAEAVSASPIAGNVTITNNAGTADTVLVTGLLAGDIVKVYDYAIGGTLLGSATVSTYDSNATVSITQLGTIGGSVYISVTSTKMQESGRTPVTYTAESATAAPNNNQIIVTNNPEGTPDTIQLTGLSASDLVKVYDSYQGGKLLGSATVTASQTVAAINVAQLGTTGGSVYVTVTSTYKSESARTKADYTAESKTDAPDFNFITVTNNAGAPDILTVTGWSSGDVIKVYDSQSGGKLLGYAAVSTGSTGVTISIAQIGSGAGTVYVSATTSGKLESDRTPVGYLAESQTTAPSANNITVTNNAGMPDTVVVSGLSNGDTVYVYDALKGGNLLGTAVVPTYDSKATVTITQLGTTTGSIYVTVTSKSNKLESDRTTVTYNGEPTSSMPALGNITIVNNAGVAGTVKVTGLVDADIINVYDAAANGNLLGSGTVPNFNTQVTVTISQLGSTGGSVYVTLTSKGKLESGRIQAAYNAKPQSDAPSQGNITIVNNVGMPDTVAVVGLAVNDIVNVYDSSNLGNQIGSATVSLGSSQVIISISQLGTTGGSVYVTVTSKGKTESVSTTANYGPEQASNNPNAGNIVIVNNAGMAGTVTVTGLLSNDVVKVYDAGQGGNLLGTASLTGNNSQVVISLPQLGTSAGTLYVSVTSTGKTESGRTPVGYTAVSNAPTIGNVFIVNNAVIADTVTVTNLTANDIVRVYDSASGGNLLGTATVVANSTQATVTIPQLTVGAGSVYVTVSNYGRTESTRCKVDYIAEQVSIAPIDGSVTVINNAFIADTITATGLTAGDVIKVFDSGTGGTLLGSATVQSNSNTVSISVTQIGTGAGSVFVSVTSLGKTESARKEVQYIAEQKSNAPSSIIIVNHTLGTDDSVTVTGLSANDIVKVYDSATNLLGSASVQAASTQVTFSLSNLGNSDAAGGTVYLTVTSTGKYESDKTAAPFTAAQ